MSKKKLKTAAIYVRVSTDAQAEEGYSVEAQKEQLAAYCISKEISVLDAFAQFIQENGRLPTRGDFDDALPSRPTIKKIFNMSLVEFEQHYFPEHYKGTNKNSHYWWFTEKDFLDCFLDNYNTIRGGLYVKYADYDLYRKPGTPAIRLIIEKLGCNSYNELIQKTGVKKRRESFNIKSNKRTIDISQEDVIV